MDKKTSPFPSVPHHTGSREGSFAVFPRVWVWCSWKKPNSYQQHISSQDFTHSGLLLLPIAFFKIYIDTLTCVMQLHSIHNKISCYYSRMSFQRVTGAFSGEQQCQCVLWRWIVSINLLFRYCEFRKMVRFSLFLWGFVFILFFFDDDE